MYLLSDFAGYALRAATAGDLSFTTSLLLSSSTIGTLLAYGCALGYIKSAQAAGFATRSCAPVIEFGGKLSYLPIWHIKNRVCENSTRILVITRIFDTPFGLVFGYFASFHLQYSKRIFVCQPLFSNFSKNFWGDGGG